jgi:hypothetical protein
VLERLEAGQNITTEECQSGQGRKRVGDRGIGREFRVEVPRGLKVRVRRFELPAIEMEQAAVEEQTSLPDRVAFAAQHPQRSGSIADDAPVEIGVDTARPAVDVDAVDLGLSSVTARKQDDRGGYLALRRSHLPVVGELIGEVAAKQSHTAPVAVLFRESDSGSQRFPRPVVAQNVLRPTQRVTCGNLGLDVVRVFRGG